MVTYLGNGKLTWVRDGKLLLITLHTFLSNVKLPLLYEADDSDTGALKLPVLGRVQRRCARMFTCSFVTGVTNVQVVARRLLTALNEPKKKKKTGGRNRIAVARTIQKQLTAKRNTEAAGIR